MEKRFNAQSASANQEDQIHWTFDLWANANGVVAGLMADGADTWFFILPDHISGHAMTNDAATAIQKLGGRELGRSTYAFPGTTDFASQLLKAKASGAKVICLANAGDDTSNCIKQAHEFGIPQSGVRLAGLVMQDYIVKSIGLDTARGLVGVMPWCWNMSAVTHYLNAAAAMGVDKAKASGRAVVEQMKSMPVNDDFYQGQIRADGKFVHNMCVWQTKTLAESTGPWDFFKLLHTIPADQAFRPIGESGCPLVKSWRSSRMPSPVMPYLSRPPARAVRAQMAGEPSLACSPARRLTMRT